MRAIPLGVQQGIWNQELLKPLSRDKDMQQFVQENEGGVHQREQNECDVLYALILQEHQLQQALYQEYPWIDFFSAYNDKTS